MSKLLENALRHDRGIVATALFIASLLAWGYLLSGAGMSMGAFEMTRHSLMPMQADMMQTPIWTPGYALLMFSMWWVMMTAMMLPSAAPTILLAAAINLRSNTRQAPFGSTGLFTAGYLLAWAGFSLAAIFTQWLLHQNGVLNSVMVSESRLISGILLITAGLWQFSPWKYACLRHCQSPLEFLSQNQREGPLGALLMGMHHGVYCLGCCWFLMALLFVGGVMNLYWIIGLTIYVWVEKVLSSGFRTGRIMGMLLVIWGTALIAGFI